MDKRIAIVVSHPIQHFCPQYTSWSKLHGVALRVFFASRHGLDAYEDRNFGRMIRWDDLSLDFPHCFLPGAAGKRVDSKTDCPALDEYLQDFSPDVVVVYGYSQPLQRRALAWARKAGCKIFMIADSELRSRKPWAKRVVKALMLPRMFKQVNAFLTVGDANEAYYRRYGVPDRRMIRTFFPIDVEAYDRLRPSRPQASADVRGQFAIPQEHIVILMVGKLVPWKRQRDLVHFSNALQDVRQDVTIILAGTGPDENSLKSEARLHGAGGVIFAGFVPPAALVSLYAASDIYAHCSDHEPHSLAISEAIYSGLPVVLSDRCGSFGPTDDVRPGLNGFVYACGDAEQLANALLRLVEDSALLTRMGEESESIAKAHQALAHGKALTQATEILM